MDPTTRGTIINSTHTLGPREGVLLQDTLMVALLRIIMQIQRIKNPVSKHLLAVYTFYDL